MTTTLDSQTLHAPRTARTSALFAITVTLASPLLLDCGSSDATPAAVPKLAPALETSLALSAAPPHIRDGAGVYSYDPASGLEPTRESQNGFHCFVARTDIQVLPFAPEYRDDVLIPICFDKLGSDHILPAWLYAEKQRAQGMSAADLVAALPAMIEAAPGYGVAPMLSPILRTMGPDGQVGSFNYPHYMYYAPGLGNDDIAAIPGSPVHTWVDNAGNYDGKQAYLIQPVGAVERAAINLEHKDMLAELCASRVDGAYCLDMTAVNSQLRAELTATLNSLE